MYKPIHRQTVADSSWDHLAERLLQAEKTMSWSATHSSFSNWVTDLARSLNRSEATVWRALAAGRYYNVLRSEFSDRGIMLPELGSSQLVASPEGLELTDKISRVAPPEVVQQIKQKVVEGKVSRRELRAYWETYRPVLEGLTARGRNVAAPRFNPRNIAMIGRRLEADCIAGLIQEGSKWLGVVRAHIYKVIPIDNHIARRFGVQYAPDVIVLYQADTKHPLEVHGVEATSQPDTNAAARHYRLRGVGIDHFWIAAPTEMKSQLEASCPEIGILEADPNGVKVLRRAGVANQDLDEKLAILKVLLAREVVA